MYNSSCLMLQTSLWAPGNLFPVFKEEDLKDEGLELDTHITIFYNKKIIEDWLKLKDDIIEILGDDFDKLCTELKSENKYKVFDYFELGKFENESDFVVLKLKSDTNLYNQLSVLNLGITRKYNLKSDFDSYKPHMTLAKLNQNTAKKYMFSPMLNDMLDQSVFNLDDFIISYGTDEGEYIHQNLTSFNAIPRFFRQEELKKEKIYYDNL